MILAGQGRSGAVKEHTKQDWKCILAEGVVAAELLLVSGQLVDQLLRRGLRRGGADRDFDIALDTDKHKAVVTGMDKWTMSYQLSANESEAAHEAEHFVEAHQDGDGRRLVLHVAFDVQVANIVEMLYG